MQEDHTPFDLEASSHYELSKGHSIYRLDEYHKSSRHTCLGHPIFNEKLVFDGLTLKPYLDFQSNRKMCSSC